MRVISRISLILILTILILLFLDVIVQLYMYSITNSTMSMWEHDNCVAQLDEDTSDLSLEPLNVDENEFFKILPTPPKGTPSTNYIMLSTAERKIFATLIKLEAGGTSIECQRDVASVVVNRMNYYGISLRDVIFAKNQFTPAVLIDYDSGDSEYSPSDEQFKVVDYVCTVSRTLPDYVLYFRSEHYHSWATPYKEIDGMYFSY